MIRLIVICSVFISGVALAETVEFDVGMLVAECEQLNEEVAACQTPWEFPKPVSIELKDYTDYFFGSETLTKSIKGAKFTAQLSLFKSKSQAVYWIGLKVITQSESDDRAAQWSSSSVTVKEPHDFVGTELEGPVFSLSEKNFLVPSLQVLRPNY